MLTTRTYRLGEMFGIPMYIDMSFLFIAATALFCAGNPLLGVFIAAGLGASIMAHEFGHSLTARNYGFRTRKITLSMLGGCAEMEGIPKVPRQEIAVALALIYSTSFAVQRFFVSVLLISLNYVKDGTHL